MSEPLNISLLPIAPVGQEILSSVIVLTPQGLMQAQATALNTFTHVIQTADVADCNQATTPGVWNLHGGNYVNGPANFKPYMGIIEVFRRYYRVYQRILGHDGKMATRCGDQSSGDWEWSEWHVV